MTYTVAKLNDRLVRVVKYADSVQFSNTRGWVLVTPDVDMPERKQREFKWVPASTRFEWVRSFAF